MLPAHLGGHLNKTHIDRGAFELAAEIYRIGPGAIVVDVGCGTGGMFDLVTKVGASWLGVDGDWTVARAGTVIHDFATGPAPFDGRYAPTVIYQGEAFNMNTIDCDRFELGWSVEFLEHVEERYLPNVMDTFSRCEVVVATAAPPGAGGHHHVNCRTLEYWCGAFAAHGLFYSEANTIRIQKASTMAKGFMARTGMVFERDEIRRRMPRL